jgi:hypothetical protein
MYTSYLGSAQWFLELLPPAECTPLTWVVHSGSWSCYPCWMCTPLTWVVHSGSWSCYPLLNDTSCLGSAQWFLMLLPLLKDISYLGSAQWFLYEAVTPCWMYCTPLTWVVHSGSWSCYPDWWRPHCCKCWACCTLVGVVCIVVGMWVRTETGPPRERKLTVNIYNIS